MPHASLKFSRLKHLSFFAVETRLRGVVFVCSEEPNIICLSNWKRHGKEHRVEQAEKNMRPNWWLYYIRHRQRWWWIDASWREAVLNQLWWVHEIVQSESPKVVFFMDNLIQPLFTRKPHNLMDDNWLQLHYSEVKPKYAFQLMNFFPITKGHRTLKKNNVKLIVCPSTTIVIIKY